MNNQQNNPLFMPEADLMQSILDNLKRTVREYTTATTESACPVVRQMFTDLTMDTLKLQGQIFNTMQQHNMYQAPGNALQMDLNKEIQTQMQTKQELTQFIQSKNVSAGNAPYAQQPNIEAHKPNYM
ncbi:spore coat protein [Paenibacillus shunpengii]|uniref:Spore coat protein n=1 Tax=Paenibacillus shunpengii TaxID=2054424 RepID=A0ABW5SJ84_9BACL|nr:MULTISPECIES: spore coat protein [unclassified Paenibacillus]OMC71582.1 spore coat protein [Paenibacillus sp. FSL H7-0326]SDW29728.1 Coat F domain-containing protein [Paenibacillus sp. PDC88]